MIMSFENMKELKDEIVHERACMLMYYFTPQEIKQIQNVARMTGITDCVLLSPSHAGNTIRDILDGKIKQGEGEGMKEKAIILNQISTTRMHAFIEGLKKCRIKRPLIAVVTSTSIEWTLNELLENLASERAALKAGTFSEH